MTDIDIGCITWSDHAPLPLRLNLGPYPTRVCHWRLNESFLSKPQYWEELGQCISNYFQFNEGVVGSQVFLWEAHKAVFRGHCIALGSRIKRNTALQISSLSIHSMLFDLWRLSWQFTPVNRPLGVFW